MSVPETMAESATPRQRGRGPYGALMVASGIFSSRILGLIRERVFAHYFGNSATADAFKAALRIPNILQNMLGEGVLSGSFIPVYSRLVGRGEKGEAAKVAYTVFLFLSLLVSLLVALGVTTAPWLVDLLAPGFSEEKRELTIRLTRIFFPGTGILVISAWCLGVLNSHHRFFLPYAAPVVWNVCIIGAMLYFGGSRNQEELAVLVAWGVVGGCLLQLLIQLPLTLRLVGQVNGAWAHSNTWVKEILKNFLPVVTARGIVQISAYVDSMVASLLPTGAVAALSYAQNIYLLPIGLFGMSITAAELPTMSQIEGSPEQAGAVLRERLERSLRQVAFFIVPTSAAFFFIGDYLISALYQTGRFLAADSVYVWLVLMTSTVGLFAATWARLYSSAFYALREVKKPLRYSLIRVLFTVVFGAPLALFAPQHFGLPPSFGLLLICFISALAAIIEYVLLRSCLEERIGRVNVSNRYLIEIWTAALLAGGCARVVAMMVPAQHLFLRGVVSATVLSLLYLAWATMRNYPEIVRIHSLVFRRRS